MVDYRKLNQITRGANGYPPQIPLRELTPVEEGRHEDGEGSSSGLGGYHSDSDSDIDVFSDPGAPFPHFDFAL